MTAAPQLLRCPFCGSDDVVHDLMVLADEIEPNTLAPGCNNCGAAAESVALWNTRAFVPPPMPEGEAIAALQADLQAYRLALGAALSIVAATGQPTPADWSEWAAKALAERPDGLSVIGAIRSAHAIESCTLSACAASSNGSLASRSRWWPGIRSSPA